MHRYGTPKAPSSVAGSTAGSSAAAIRYVSHKHRMASLTCLERYTS
ncbi:hypothetical protein IMZ48_41980 [Candidatus Bathyarchaeota archaeon]|nr:hypothetical protein [Candidatus Bathyarchaeota archaeon]